MKKTQMFMMALVAFMAGVVAVDANAARDDKHRIQKLEQQPVVVAGASLDVSASNQTTGAASPVQGRITKVYGYNESTITTQGTTTVSLLVDGVTQTTITVPSGTTAGTLVSATIADPSATVSEGSRIRLNSDGGATQGGAFNWLFSIRPDVQR